MFAVDEVSVTSRCAFSGAPEGGGAERSMSGQTKPDGEERVKTGAGQRERRPADGPEAAELRAADQR